MLNSVRRPLCCGLLTLCFPPFSRCLPSLQEREAELASLRRRAHMVTDGFNELEDVTCNFTEGAMYSFPQVRGTHACCSPGATSGVLGCVWTGRGGSCHVLVYPGATEGGVTEKSCKQVSRL